MKIDLSVCQLPACSAAPVWYAPFVHDLARVCAAHRYANQPHVWIGPRDARGGRLVNQSPGGASSSRPRAS